MALKWANNHGIKNWMLGFTLLFSVTVFSQPTITQFSPNYGTIGSVVTITGTNLNNPTAITIGGVSAIPVSNNGSTLVALVMPGATTGIVSVTTGAGTANSAGNFIVISSAAPSIQQGSKLVGTDAVGAAEQGFSVALSADGNTAIVGGYFDNSNIGAAWVYTRNGNSWTQQGSKLVGTGAVGSDIRQGVSVSLSADGNTAMVGGYRDNNLVGAVWVYTRTAGVWTQQGNKLVGSDVAGTSRFGRSVALSPDGNTALIGGWGDNNDAGAAWIFTRSGGVWTQQGNKLLGTGKVGNSEQGVSVALSADGNTAITGGWADNNYAGAAWIFSRSGNDWIQQGNKLVGSGAIGNARQGLSVAVSADGNTAIVGGFGDNGNIGAAWVYTRSGSVWSQQGNKLVGSGAVGSALQGYSVSLSADGNTAIIGGNGDNGNSGASWIFSRSGNTWTEVGSKIIGTGAIGNARQGRGVAISLDGRTAIAAGDADNSLAGAAWIFGSPLPTPTITSFSPVSAGMGTTMTIVGTELAGTYAISLGGTPVTSFTVVSNTSIIAVVGSGSSGAVSLTTPGGNASLTGFTFIASPTITSFTPTIAATGAIISITGTNFTNTSAITLGGTAVTSFTVVSSTSIVAIVGAGSSGAVSLTTPGGTATLTGFTFIPAPIITSFTAIAGPIGTLVTINGSNLTNPSNIMIAGVPAIPISNNGTTLVVMVMPGATFGSVNVTTGGGTATGPGNFSVTASLVPNRQQGNKLVGSGNVDNAYQGISVAISADGNTAVVGGIYDNSLVGAAWIFTRSGGAWVQQGNKLVGTDAIGGSQQGYSVAISADGNTVIVGGYTDNSNEGAAWIFTRTGGAWTQQGNKLVGTGASGNAYQGTSVALSADGNTAMVGGHNDGGDKGAVWIYTRSAGVWTQEGSKLEGAGATGNARQGWSVALSADGNTAMVGGYRDNGNAGASWIFTRTGGTWTQQGTKLVGTGTAGNANQGISVSLSADGNTAIVGGVSDNSNVGASWIFTRSGSTWTQQGNKLVGTGAVGNSYQGYGVSLSADGNIAVVGAYGDNGNSGAAWMFTRNGTNWAQHGIKLVGTGANGNAQQGRSVSISADGNTAIVGGYGDNSNSGASWVYIYLPPPPTITSFTPTVAATGTLISITGTNFENTSVITLGGTPVNSFTVVSSTSIIAVVGSGSSGAVSLTTPGGTASLAGFTFIPAPTITSFTPTIAAAGTLINITGTNFENTSAITLGGTPVSTFTVVSSTSIIAIVGSGSSGAVSLTTPGGSASLNGFTFIPAPTITLFSPAIAGAGAVISITGTNFLGTTAITLGGTLV
ncbi:MAG: beta strand repeat-containing protein, partial [Bacteroidota bacterium]